MSQVMNLRHPFLLLLPKFFHRFHDFFYYFILRFLFVIFLRFLLTTTFHDCFLQFFSIFMPIAFAVTNFLLLYDDQFIRLKSCLNEFINFLFKILLMTSDDISVRFRHRMFCYEDRTAILKRQNRSLERTDFF